MTETDEVSRATMWPLSGLRVASGDLELRYADDEMLFTLANVAAAGVHAPDARPFTVPWTSGTPVEVARAFLTYHWGLRSRMSPQNWALDLAVVHSGRPVGMQGLLTHDYPVTRAAETGSWLGLRHQGQGIGTRMRLLMLHLAFDGFGAEVATTSAFEDNGPSNAVTRKVGYEPNGTVVVARQEEAALSRQYWLKREAWETRPAWQRMDVEMSGVEAAREFLGIE